MAERLLIHKLQKKYFQTELNHLIADKRPPSSVDLVIGPDGLICVRTRLQNATIEWEAIHPILPPHKSQITRVLLQSLHLQNGHAGVSHLINIARNCYHIR